MERPAVRRILVLGAGSAGLLAALSLKRKIPRLEVRVVRSPSLGVIGVGEATTPNFTGHLFGYLGIRQSWFYSTVRPTWKIGIRFLWGPRSHFDYAFEPQLDVRHPDLPLDSGYYCDASFENANVNSALMAQCKAFARTPNGDPAFDPFHAFHIENTRFVAGLEMLCAAAGIEILDGEVAGAERGPRGVAAVVLKDGRRLEADLFVDASGFRSELLGRAMEEPFVSFDKSLFCDRAIVGGWTRTTEPILPYTLAETMDAGWCWRIDHEDLINRGYVHCSDAISEADATAEFLAKNPKIDPGSTRVVKYRSGRFRRGWVENVVAIGNAGGFVEPLESTGLMMICQCCQLLTGLLQQCDLRPSPTTLGLFNRVFENAWEDIRDFLSLHYKLNTRLQTPFWQRCREETSIGRLEDLLAFYREHGPTRLCKQMLRHPDNNFGLEGHLVMLVGNRVAYDRRPEITDADRSLWERYRTQAVARATTGLSAIDALAKIHHPHWQWAAEKPA